MSFLLAHVFLYFLEREFHERRRNFMNVAEIS